MKSRKSRKKVFRCQECGAEAVKWEGRCPVCLKWNTMQEVGADSAAEKKEVSLPPEVQAVLERLVAGVRVDRKRAAGTLRYLTEKPPHGLWLSVDRLEILVHDVLVRHEQDSLDNPLGYMVVLARQPEKKTVAGAVNRPEVEESWKPLAGPGGMKSLKDVIDKLDLPESAAAERVATRMGSAQDASSAAAPSEDGCETCDSAGFVLPRRLDAAAGRPPEPEVCPKCGGETAEEKGERLLAASRLSGLQLEMTLDRLEEVEGLGVALAAVDAFLSGEVSQLVLIGGTGRGKSHLAIGVLLACMERGELCLYLNVARFLDELRMTFENNARDQFSQLMRPPLEWDVVVLDDLAGQRATDWATEKLYEIVDGRYGKGLKTIACSNHPMKTWDPRIVSRLSDNRRSRVVVLETKDYRLVPRPVGVA